MKVTAKDGANASVSDTFNLTVVNVNDRPVATFTTDQIFNEDSGPQTGQLTASDEETPSASLTYSLTQAIAGLTLNANGAWTFDTANSNYQYLGAYGDQTIEVNYSVFDGQLSGVGSFMITLNGVNDVATITGPSTGLVNANSLVSVAGGSLVVSDVDSGENTFLGTGTVNTLATNGQFSFNYGTGSWAYAPTQVTTPGAGHAKIYQDVLSGLKSMDQTATADVKVGIYVAGATDNTNLVLDGSASLDLSALRALDNSIKVDKVDMSSAGANSLKLDVASVLAMNTTGKLVVDGGATDQVDLVGTWTKAAATQTPNAKTYDVYTLDGAEVWIQNTVNNVI